MERLTTALLHVYNASLRSRVGVGMKSAMGGGGQKMKSALSGPTDWILRYIKTTFFTGDKIVKNR